MRDFLRENGLAIVAFALFIAFWVAMGIAGYLNHNEQLRENGRQAISATTYLCSGHFWEATSENWESEFLQMGLFVLLTALLFQKGSAESKTEEEDHEEQTQEDREQAGQVTEVEGQPTPGPVRRGGLVKTLYENSLAIVLLSLFFLSFALHALSGVREYNVEQSFQNKPPIDVWEFLSTNEFWFQSFQNWQSEFLAVGAMVVLTIFLRQKGSAESKPVGAPTSQTGQG